MKLFALLTLLIFSAAPAQARETSVVLSPALFQAGQLLLGLPQTKVRLNGREGVIQPSNGLKKLGMTEPLKFKVELNTLARAVSAQANSIELQSLDIALIDGGLRLRLQFSETAGPGIHSSTGDVHLQNLGAVIELKTDSKPGFSYSRGALSGDFRASGFPSIPFLLSGNSKRRDSRKTRR